MVNSVSFQIHLDLCVTREQPEKTGVGTSTTWDLGFYPQLSLQPSQATTLPSHVTQLVTQIEALLDHSENIRRRKRSLLSHTEELLHVPRREKKRNTLSSITSFLHFQLNQQRMTSNSRNTNFSLLSFPSQSQTLRLPNHSNRYSKSNPNSSESRSR